MTLSLSLSLSLSVFFLQSSGMACSISILIPVLIKLFFLRTCLSITATRSNCSIRASNIYCLDSGLPSTWYNNNSVIMSGWQMRVFLIKHIQDGLAFYSGFYCNQTCTSYVFSVVAVEKGTHTVVWSANHHRPVKGNATIQLTTSGLELRDSDGSRVWSANTSRDSITGMALDSIGTLGLFSNETEIVWQSNGNYTFRNTTSLSSPFPTTNSTPPSTAGTDFPQGGGNVEQPPGPPKGGGVNLMPIILGSTAGGVFVICLIFVLFMRLRKAKADEDVEEYIKQVPGMPVRFSFEDLRVATEDFRERLGGGGFGSVFKGELPDGTEIAVKRLDRIGQGMREFLAEVETIGSLHHFNLVRLIGFCAEKSFRLLVYEYMSNGSLDNWIFCKDQRPCLDWETRKKIVLDIARGLTYLHEDCRQRIIHFDIKPQNILLDENFNAKVSDFGLSKLINRDESQVTTTMRGTPGYLAPEWQTLRITVEVDIYSFGIVLLETICGRRNLERYRSESSLHLLRVLQEKAGEDRLIDIVDNLDDDMLSHRDEVVRMIKIGAWCLQDDDTRRPNMSTVVKVLEGVMEVDPNINFRFTHALIPSSVVDDNVSTAPLASVLSNPR